MNPEGAPIQLTRRLYDTLLYMAERPGRLIEKQALMDAVWKGAVVEENTLSRTISNLRQVLGERGGEHRYIETVSGLGYRFIATVTSAGSAGALETTKRVPSIAVLPFEDLSRERDQAYFADGIAEEVLNRLASVHGLRVIAKASSFRFRESGDGAQAVGRTLGADYLLSGSVRKGHRDLRITARLVEAATDSQLWSESFDRAVDLENVFASQDEIARSVTRALHARLDLGDPTPTYRSTEDAEAYDLFLRGRAQYHLGGGPSLMRAVELFRAAVQRDPRFAPAWLWLASTGRSRLIFAAGDAARALAELEEGAAKTLELAPTWSATHIAQGWRHHVRRDWIAMERSLAEARTLGSPLPGELEGNLATFYSNVNDSRAALEHFRIAATVDPLSMLASGLLQKELVMAGRFDEAQAEYERSLDLPGDREIAEHLQLHMRWARGEPFREQLRRYLDSTQTKPAPVLEEVYAVCDDPPRALEKLRAAATAAAYRSPIRQVVLAWWLAAYGDVDGAFDALWRGFVDLGFINPGWLWFPVFAGVREHARFPELLERVGLTAYWRSKNR